MASKDWFATTHWSVVIAAGDTAAPGSANALAALCRVYWYPLYAYIRQSDHNPHDAQDLTQEFFDEAMTRLSEECIAAGKSECFALLKVFLARDAASGEYAPLGAQLNMSANGVAVAVHRLRERYRERVRAEIAHTVGSPSEIDEEIRYLFEVLRG